MCHCVAAATTVAHTGGGGVCVSIQFRFYRIYNAAAAAAALQQFASILHKMQIVSADADGG